MTDLPTWCGRVFTLALVVVIVGSTLSASAVAASAGPTATSGPTHAAFQPDNGTDTSTAGNTPTDTATATPASQCDGQPRMSSIDVVSVDSKITPEQAGTVEANFRVDPNVPAQCEVVVDIQYRLMDDGFQLVGGADWKQAASTIVATQFTLGSGEVRSISAQIRPNGAEVGDEVTIVADLEIWYEGNREDSRQIKGVRSTLTVTDETATPSPSPTPTPQQNDGDSDDQQDGQDTDTPTPVDDPPIWEENPILLITLVSVVGIVLVAIIAARGGMDIIAFGK